MKLSMGRLGLVVFAVGLLTIGSGAAAVYAQAATTIQMAEFSFAPDNMAVSSGASRWTLQNVGQFPHNVHIEGNGVSMDVKPDGPALTISACAGAAHASPMQVTVTMKRKRMV